MRNKKVMGGKFTTSEKEQEILNLIDDGVVGNSLILTNVTIYNVGANEISVMINDGTRIPIDSKESLYLGDLQIKKVVVVEKGSTVKILGIC